MSGHSSFPLQAVASVLDVVTHEGTPFIDDHRLVVAAGAVHHCSHCVSGLRAREGEETKSAAGNVVAMVTNPTLHSPTGPVQCVEVLVY